MIEFTDLEDINIGNVDDIIEDDGTGVRFKENDTVTTDKIKDFRERLFYVEIPKVCLYSEEELSDGGVIMESDINKITNGALFLSGGYTLSESEDMESIAHSTHQVNINGLYKIVPGRLEGDNIDKMANVYQGSYPGGNNPILSEVANVRKGKQSSGDMLPRKAYKNIDEIIDIHNSGYSVTIINISDIKVIYNFVYDVVNNHITLPDMSPNIQVLENEKFEAYRNKLLEFTHAVYAQNRKYIEGTFKNNIWDVYSDHTFKSSIVNVNTTSTPKPVEKVKIVEDQSIVTFGNMNNTDDFLDQ